MLFRTNAQSQAYEEALAEAGVPTSCRGPSGSSNAPRCAQAMVALRAATRTDGRGRRAARQRGRRRWRRSAGARTSRRRAARPGSGGRRSPPWSDWPRSSATRGRWPSSPRNWPAGPPLQHAPTVDGVTLASLHSAKGLEWDAVFLVGLVEGVLPTSYAKTPAALEEERRLLYVGITRARQWLTPVVRRRPGRRGRARRPSRFLPVDDAPTPGAPGGRRGDVRDADGTRRRIIAVPCRVCGATLTAPADRKLGRCATCPSTMDEELFERLRQWRLAHGRGPGRAGVRRLHRRHADRAGRAAARRSRATCSGIAGIGPHKLGRYGEAVLALVGGARPADLVEPVGGRKKLRQRSRKLVCPRRGAGA